MERNSNLAPFAEWVENGDLIVSPGDVISVGTIYDTFGMINDHCDVRYLAYDPHKAESVTQIIEQGASSVDGGELSKGYGVERVSVNQGTALFEPINEFEALAIENKIRHPGNKVFDWMMGNIHVKDTAGRKRLLKADEGLARVRKIDGPVAAVTALALAIDNEYRPQPSVYESRGLLTL
jgi:phage terminase large subunit-like protein